MPQPQQPLLGHMPGLLNPQQLQGLLMLRQHPAMFSNPVLQSQLAMLMWNQMQQQHAPLWPLHQPGPVLQPAGGHQPFSAAAQSASTHQPSCPGPLISADPSSPLSHECNSSGGSNDSGCMQSASGGLAKAEQSPSADPQKHFPGGHRFADDSDSAVTWAGRAGRGTEQACTQSRSAGHPEASGQCMSFKLYQLFPHCVDCIIDLCLPALAGSVATLLLVANSYLPMSTCL